MARLKELKKTLSTADFEDVAQEAFMQSMVKAFGKDYFEKYLHKAMVNIALNSLRRNNKDADLTRNLTRMMPLLNLESLDLICDVHRLFRSAEYTQKQIHACYLYFCANFSLREISRLYGQNHTYWRRLFNRTKTLFRKELSDYKFLSPRKKAGTKRSNGTVPKGK